MAESLSDRAARFAARARGMLPKGRAWARHTGAELLDVLTATTYELARVEARSDEFRTEMDPAQTSALLSEWESALGLPDECGTPTTTEARRAAILARLTDSGTNTVSALETALANFDSGATLEIGTPTQFEVGTDGGAAGRPVGGDEWAHTKILRITTSATVDRDEIECVLNNIKRAHGHYIYEYMNPPIAGYSIDLNPESSATSVVSGVVAQLGDDSGNGYHATQSTAADRPTYNLEDADFGYRPSAQGDGASDHLATPSYQPGGGGTDYTLYLVFKTAASASVSVIYGATVGGGTGRLQLRESANGTNVTVRWDSPGGSITQKVLTTTANTVYRLAIVFDVATGADAIPTIYIDGVESGVGYTLSGASDDTEFEDTEHGVFATPLGGADWAGKIARIIGYDAAHTADQIALMDAWLADHFTTVLPAATYSTYTVTTEGGDTLTTESGLELALE